MLRVDRISNNINSIPRKSLRASVSQNIKPLGLVSNVKYTLPEKLKIAAVTIIYGSVAKEVYSKVIAEEKNPNNVSEFSMTEIKQNFEKNGFKKDIFSNYIKALSQEEKQKLEEKTGYYYKRVRDYYEHPYGKLDFAYFKDFLELGKEKSKNLLKNNFHNLFVTFSTICNLYDYKNVRKRMKDNPAYFDLVKNIIENPIDKETADSLNKYKNMAYWRINTSLRKHERVKDFEIDEDTNKHINNISKYIDTQVIENPITLYRGEGKDILNYVKTKDGKSVNIAEMMDKAIKSNNTEDFKKIQEFVMDNELISIEPGFLSTSITKNIADDFATKECQEILWHLKTQPKTKGVFIEGVNLGGEHNFENEVLMQKGSKIVIKDIKYNKNGKYWDIDGEISN